MRANHALHRTLHQRRFACWFRAGEGSRYAASETAEEIGQFDMFFAVEHGIRGWGLGKSLEG